MNNLNLGQLIAGEQQRDAVHVAVAPVVAGKRLMPGDHIGLSPDGTASDLQPSIGVVDPFLKRRVNQGERFWMFLYPGTITSLRHEWTHPEMEKQTPKSDAEKWMMEWANKHMREDYYGDGLLTEQHAFDKAIQAGHDLSVGPYQSARDSIDDQWWNYWEVITGVKGERGEYFSCSC